MANAERLNWIDDALAQLREGHVLRSLATQESPRRPALFRRGDRQFVNFGSNDYLGLANDERLKRAAAEAAEQEGWGSGSSPLIVGHCRSHAVLESDLAAFEGTEAALVFASGYTANLGTIAALVGRGDAVYSDELNHASIVDGCRLSRAEVRVFRHGDVSHLAELLADAASFRRRLIVSDGVFSMDGDLAPLTDLADLADRRHCMLAVDEAHGTGVFGDRGRGACEACGIEDRVDVKLGTLSKALGSAGGFVAGRRALVDWLVNKARPYIFSTAMPPATAAASRAALKIVAEEPNRRSDVLNRAALFREALAARGWDIGRSCSQIIPLVVGDAARTLQMAARLREQGFWTPPIRPPSVPVGASRLRLSLSYDHAPEAIDALLAALDKAAADV